MRIYVASSWRNPHQPDVVRFLRQARHDVYDFRLEENGVPGGFQWTQLPNWKPWPPSAFREQLKDPIARYGFRRDMTALTACEVCVLVLPCGRSAHLELGFALGSNKGAIVHYPQGIAQQEPELMYSDCRITVDDDELLDAVRQYAQCQFLANDDSGERCGIQLHAHQRMDLMHPHSEART